jgi:HK97 family phage major capsid protein
MRLHSRDRRKWFAVNFCRSYFKTNPVSPGPLLAFSLPAALLLAITFIFACPHLAFAGGMFMPFPVAGDLELQLKETKAELLRAWNEIKTANDASREALQTKITTLQRQVDGIDIKVAGRSHIGGVAQKGLADLLKVDEGFARLQRDRKGTAILNLEGDDCRLLQRKTAITETAVGVSTTGVMPIERISGIVPEARQTLFLRSLFVARPTSQLLVDFVKVNAPMTKASPQTEGSDKAENAVTFTAASEKIRTLATWIPCSKQILDDFTELANFINDSLTYYLALAEELEMLSGDNSGEHLHGVIGQAASFNTALLVPASAGWTYIDVLACAIEQLAIAKEISPSFAVLNPVDWWKIRRIKNSLGNYIVGDPSSQAMPRLWDLDIIPTVNMTAGTFLVGSGDPAAIEIRDRMQAQIEVSTSHSDYFVKNLAAVRIEKRLALITKRAAAFIYGTFNSSP